jgi:hypothetical protein
VGCENLFTRRDHLDLHAEPSAGAPHGWRRKTESLTVGSFSPAGPNVRLSVGTGCCFQQGVESAERVASTHQRLVDPRISREIALCGRPRGIHTLGQVSQVKNPPGGCVQLVPDGMTRSSDASMRRRPRTSSCADLVR